MFAKWLQQAWKARGAGGVPTVATRENFTYPAALLPEETWIFQSSFEGTWSLPTAEE